MLGKTANGLFWMYRYLERAEIIARLIETGQRIALTRLQRNDEEWTSVLQSADALSGFQAANGEVSKDAAIDWLLRDKDNPSSIYSCIAAARQNGRMVRTAITGDVWEATNSAYMKTKTRLARRVSERDLPAVLKEIRQAVSLVRGTTLGTMMRNDIYDFTRIGTFLERADTTARILDVKYYVLLPSARAVGTSLDNVQWETILRSVSARGGFRMEYGASGGPQEIADFLILNRRMPRSLAFCIDKIEDNLGYLAKDRATSLPTSKKVSSICRELRAHTIEDIFSSGLHEFLQSTLGHLSGLSRQIEIDFRFYE